MTRPTALSARHAQPHPQLHPQQPPDTAGRTTLVDRDAGLDLGLDLDFSVDDTLAGSHSMLPSDWLWERDHHLPPDLEPSDPTVDMSTMLTYTNNHGADTPLSLSAFSNDEAAPCTCALGLTAELARLAAIPQPIADLPLDAFLACSKNAIAVATRILDCNLGSTHDDVLLPILYATLLLHLVCICDAKITMFTVRGPSSASSKPLSLGSYQLEAHSMNAVHASLIQIELARVRGLLDAFGDRFGGPIIAESSAHAVTSLLTYVRRRLVASLDAVRAWPLHND
jgi:hypothetical protein